MTDYISRQAAIARVIRLIEDDEEVYDCKEALKNIPAADVIELGERYYFKDKYLFEIKADENGRNEWFRIKRAEQ